MRGYLAGLRNNVSEGGGFISGQNSDRSVRPFIDK